MWTKLKSFMGISVFKEPNGSTTIRLEGISVVLFLLAFMAIGALVF